MAFSRWRRVASAGACDWCLMLATRGAVYYSSGTARAASAGINNRPDGGHRNCNCGVELETQFNRRNDVRISPDDADRVVSYYSYRMQWRYAYDMSKYRNLNVTKPPIPKPTIKPKPTPKPIPKPTPKAHTQAHTHTLT